MKAKPMSNVDGSPIKDAEDKQPPAWLLLLGVLILIPVFIFRPLMDRIRQGRYWRMSGQDYAILQRKMQRKKKREKGRNRQ